MIYMVIYHIKARNSKGEDMAFLSFFGGVWQPHPAILSLIPILPQNTTIFQK
jgi:hypothetical protein